MITNLHRFFARTVLVGAALAALAGCAVPREAYDVGARLDGRIIEQARTTAAEMDAQFAPIKAGEEQRAWGEMWERLVAASAADGGTSSTLWVGEQGRLRDAFVAGSSATRARLNRFDADLDLLTSKVRDIGAAVEARRAMSEAERRAMGHSGDEAAR